MTYKFDHADDYEVHNCLFRKKYSSVCMYSNIFVETWQLKNCPKKSFSIFLGDIFTLNSFHITTWKKLCKKWFCPNLLAVMPQKLLNHQNSQQLFRNSNTYLYLLLLFCIYFIILHFYNDLETFMKGERF